MKEELTIRVAEPEDAKGLLEIYAPYVEKTAQRNFYMATLKDAYHPPVVDIFKQFVIDQTRGELDYRTI